MVVRDGHLFGGNAAFALAGCYLESRQGIAVEITTVQRNDNSGFKPVPGMDKVTLRGRREVSNRYSFEDGSALLAAARVIAFPAPLSGGAAPPAGPNGADPLHHTPLFAFT